MAALRGCHPENMDIPVFPLDGRVKHTAVRFNMRAYQGVIPERRVSRVLSGIHLTACASFDMDSRQSLCDFGNDDEDNRKQNEPDSIGSSTAMTGERMYTVDSRVSSLIASALQRA
jgi:hypothetical protein